ncbi:PSD1 and planctomycete cytochrome C domain-containing protein [bacterium]|nr:PSD1 and planctomycete cytochrome C domain-containing protein [bacterium]
MKKLCCVITSLVVASILSIGEGLCADEIDFNAQIRPILAENCLHCHGPDADKREGELRLDLEDAAKTKAIVAGKPTESELIKRILSTDEFTKMPPPESGKALTPAQIQLLKQWVSEGANYAGHWAFEPIQKPESPPDYPAAKTDIDRFVLAKLKSQGLSLTPRITKQQLIRRATFDLIGLPPTWEEVQNFVNDESPNAFEKVIDRLLASPHYGERWGRHWLDIARYADTHGGAAIGFTKFPFSYTYRDYVIRTLNADTPYNQFVVEQLAADQLGLPANDPALAGLGFLTVGMQFRNPHDTIDDQIDVVSRGMLGLTVACARCHDHKYDPIPTSDYYSLYATLASSESPQLLPVVGTPESTPAYQKYQADLADRQAAYDDMAREQNAVMRGRLKMQVGLYLKELAKGIPEQDLASVFLSYRTDDLRPRVLEAWRKYLKQFDATDPVFGAWHQLSALKAEEFEKRSLEILQKMTDENGDPTKWAAPQSLGAAAPRWNPRVIGAIKSKQPKSMLDVAEAYGTLFADVHQQWLKLLQETVKEAVPGAEVIPDEDARHADVNSPINRQLRTHLYKPGTPTSMDEKAAARELNRSIRDSLNGRANQIHNLHLSSPGSPPRAMALKEDQQTDDFYIFRRGSPVSRGETVEAHFLTALSTGELEQFPDGKRRLGLARSIVDPDNPLTRRVFVNWVWRNHFGKGLVRTPDNFGTRGQPPTHPELLDHLATTFAEDGWSLKKLHRRIMLSVVYQQGAVENKTARMIDPDNKFLWRMPRRRLKLEAMRDSMLAVSGELNPAQRGRPFDYLSNPVNPRRSVYAFVNRDIVHNLASTFDSANPNACTAKRPDTNVPQQTLFALNSDFIQDRAAKLAAHSEVSSAESDEERVKRLYQRTFARQPDERELKIALNYVRNNNETSKTNPWQRLAHVLLAANEFVFVD